MTREEAQTSLAKLKRYISGGGVIDRKANEALDMAIEALSREPNEDVISRREAIEDAREAFKRNPTMAIRVMDLIKSMPSAQPEIVRCKDCTRYEKKRGCNLAEGLNVATAECFCSYAERREK